MITEPLKAPFPYFGGKSRVADLIWSRLGDVPNYVEPFAGSLATLLARPHEPKTETVNDADCYLSNFWRAIQSEPDLVATWADWPVNEADLLARHRWLLAQGDFVARMRSDPHYFDAKIAGWWVWGACSWIGQGWCVNESNQLPHLGNAGRGINRKLPHLGNAGMGAPARVPGTTRTYQLVAYFREIAERIRSVRVACGDWERVLGPSVTFHHGTTGILLDPPYGEGDMEYAAGGNDSDLVHRVRDWAVENGGNPELRIALCGYEGVFEMPDDWDVVPWKNRGGYGSQGDGEGRENSHRERIWFSPACLDTREQMLFA